MGGQEVNIIDRKGEFVGVLDEAIVSTSDTHDKAHKGKMFFVSHVFENVGDGETVYIRHYGATTKYLNSILTIQAGGDWTISTYAGTTYSNNGTVISPIKRKSDSTETVETVFTHTPTITNLGTLRLKERFGYGTNQSASTTGRFDESIESIFAPGVDVLIALKNNNTSGTYYISCRFDFYETDN